MGSDNAVTKGMWVKLSVDFLDDPKIIAAGLEGEVLFIRSLAWAKKQSEPVVPAHMLGRIGYGIADPVAVAELLVGLGLWTRVDGGFGITAWDQWQTDLSARTAAGSLGAHRRWHKAGPVDGCEHCVVKPTVPVRVSDDARRLCDLLVERMVANGCRRPAVTDTWLRDMDAIMRLDRHEVGTVEAVIVWCQSDSFWKSNILSPAKLRKQFETLRLRMGLNVESVKPVVPVWVADPDCVLCGGDGLMDVGDNTYGPCSCRRVPT